MNAESHALDEQDISLLADIFDLLAQGDFEDQKINGLDLNKDLAGPAPEGSLLVSD